MNQAATVSEGELTIRKFYTKFNRSRENMAQGNLNSCLLNLIEALQIKINGRFLKRDLDVMAEDLSQFVQKLGASKLFRETHGPVNFAAGQEKQWLDFFSQIVFLTQNVLERYHQAQELLDLDKADEARAIGRNPRLATSAVRQRARDVATLSRLRLYRNSIPRGASSGRDVAME